MHTDQNTQAPSMDLTSPVQEPSNEEPMKRPRFRELIEGVDRPSERELKRARKQCTPKPIKLVCSDCGRSRKATRGELLNRTRLRCLCCGGPLNRYQEA
ncbi:hypothetical protein SAMN06265222_101630 [Neorhodopirellula lusitana]|uniref:Uncharacterized protein n=1 Tax=Neorhodopirellula lusitana TaxID=445327 RepID=A0ABY1PQV9_9BACT|nr:hypothetical protein SAMN06265222_101630 [Neorhodopirellula lusitana]